MDCQEYKPEIDFKYFIYLAFSKKMSWEMLGNLFEDLTQTLTQAKDLNKVLLEELRLCNSKLHENSQDVAGVPEVSEVEEIENEPPEINDDTIESIKDQEKQNFEIKGRSEQDERELIEIQMKDENVKSNSIFKEDQEESENGLCEVKSVGYDFEYDFVGSNGTETRRLALDTKFENESEGSGSQNPFQNTSLQEEDNIFDVKEDQLEKELFHSDEEQNMLNHEADIPNKGKRYQCKKCDKAFVFRNGLRRHQNIHKEQNPYACNTCSKAFGDTSDLKRHERIHTGERPFICKICEKGFTQSGELKKHETIHSGEKDSFEYQKKYHCNKCDKAFASIGSLKRHENIHLDGNPYTVNSQIIAALK